MTHSQSEFTTALLNPEAEIPEGLTDGQGAPAGRRFAVYRNNVASSLTDALEQSFPATAKLIGAENFRKLAGIFLRQHPPSHPILSQYGADMPAFLEGFAPLQHIGYLPDVAKLEQAMRVSYHAADAGPADASILGTLSPEALAEVRLTLAPSLQLLSSDWPVHAIWAFNMRNGPKPQAGGQNVLILRAEFDPEPHPVSDGTASFVTALQNGATLSDAQEAAATSETGFDLSTALTLLLSQHAISDIRSEPTS